jgi:hypothetical protein
VREAYIDNGEVLDKPQTHMNLSFTGSRAHLAETRPRRAGSRDATLSVKFAATLGRGHICRRGAPVTHTSTPWFVQEMPCPTTNLSGDRLSPTELLHMSNKPRATNAPENRSLRSSYANLLVTTAE